MKVLKVRVGMLKAIPKKWDKEANWKTMERLIRDSAMFDIDVAITPECFLDGYVVQEKDWTTEQFIAVAEPKEGVYLGRIRDLAEDLGIYIIAGLTEMQGDGFFNSAYLFSPNGDIEGKFRKIHPYKPHERYTPGNTLPVFDTKLGRVGILICADRVWPENMWVLAVEGAKVIFLPAYGNWNEFNKWRMRVRSHENGVYVCFTHPYQALITGPDGNVVAELTSDFEDVLIHDLDLDLTKTELIEKRRPDLYKILAEKQVR